MKRQVCPDRPFGVGLRLGGAAAEELARGDQRAKIEPDPSQPRYVLTVWGVGYKFSDRESG